MLFNSFSSFEFLVFFCLVTGFYFILPNAFRWLLLLAASSIFCTFFIPTYGLALLFIILIDYFSAMLIERLKGRGKKLLLIVSIFFVCAVPFLFRCFNFFDANFTFVAHALQWNYSVESLKLILPIGLAFHSFQSISYLIEVCGGRQKAETHFGIYALYVIFYPQLMAGPIERPQNLLHQFYEEHRFDYQRAVQGLQLMTWGLFKKVVIADRLAIFVNQVYQRPSHFDGAILMLATLGFSFQIFCDFSGYSDMAIGAARVMGFRLSKNFDAPYSSKTLEEFWKRWHTSLSAWVKDYVYIPFGGSRVTAWKRYCNLLCTFMIGGLLYGVNWTFLVWGALNGLGLCASIWTYELRKKVARWTGLSRWPSLHAILKNVIIFFIISYFWIFFRATNLTDAMYVATHLFVGIENLIRPSYWETTLCNMQITGFGKRHWFYSIFFIVVMEMIHRNRKDLQVNGYVSERAPVYYRWACHYFLIFSIIFFGTFKHYIKNI